MKDQQNESKAYEAAANAELWWQEELTKGEDAVLTCVLRTLVPEIRSTGHHTRRKCEEMRVAANSVPLDDKGLPITDESLVQGYRPSTRCLRAAAKVLDVKATMCSQALEIIQQRWPGALLEPDATQGVTTTQQSTDAAAE